MMRTSLIEPRKTGSGSGESNSKISYVHNGHCSRQQFEFASHFQENSVDIAFLIS